MLNIDSMENGIVIDHITAGRGMRIYELLELDKLDTCVAIIKNARSSKYGKKDIIKIEGVMNIEMCIRDRFGGDPMSLFSKKRALVLFGSPRSHGMTRKLLDSFLSGFYQNKDWSVEEVSLYELSPHPCTGCRACAKKERCV